MKFIQYILYTYYITRRFIVSLSFSICIIALFIAHIEYIDFIYIVYRKCLI